jgi:hypothetical protein
LEQIDKAKAHANPAWRDTAIAIIQQLAIHQDLLTAFDVRRELEDKPEQTTDLRAIGSVLLAARRLKYIEKIGYERRSDQNNVTALWRSCLRGRSK